MTIIRLPFQCFSVLVRFLLKTYFEFIIFCKWYLLHYRFTFPFDCLLYFVGGSFISLFLFIAPEARVGQETTDEAEPRPPPPPPSPQHKLYKHPHCRTPGEKSVVFGPSSESDGAYSELDLAQPSVSQLRTLGI
mgnify:CR=1 FL=1